MKNYLCQPPFIQSPINNDLCNVTIPHEITCRGNNIYFIFFPLESISTKYIHCYYRLIHFFTKLIISRANMTSPLSILPYLQTPGHGVTDLKLDASLACSSSGSRTIECLAEAISAVCYHRVSIIKRDPRDGIHPYPRRCPQGLPPNPQIPTHWPYWPTVGDGGLTLSQHSVNTSYFLGWGMAERTLFFASPAIFRSRHSVLGLVSSSAFRIVSTARRASAAASATAATTRQK